MTNNGQVRQKNRKWLYPIIYMMFVVFNFLPLFAQKPYAPQDTQDVILNLLMVAIEPYKQFSSIFNIITLLLIVLIAVYGEKTGKFLAAYIGLNYLVIAFAQGMGSTEKYGFVVQTGSLITSILLGIAWIVAAYKGTLKPSFMNVPWWRYLLFPLALIAFWSPYDSLVQPYFNPILLISSPDYGLTFCFTTPVFLFLLILFYPKVDTFAYKITAFNGLLYGLFNMTHLFNPQLRWMGVLHFPLLILSIYAMVLPRIQERNLTKLEDLNRS